MTIFTVNLPQDLGIDNEMAPVEVGANHAVAE
jgi:hypothetical protein